jgi:putative YhbY family RNA-binding protein
MTTLNLHTSRMQEMRHNAADWAGATMPVPRGVPARRRHAEVCCGYNREMPVSLTPRERAHLKARAHSLEPKVMVGHGGVTPALIAEVDRALAAHELIKVKILGDDRDAREVISNALCAGTDAAPVQRVGKVLVLWRPKPEKTE